MRRLHRQPPSPGIGQGTSAAVWRGIPFAPIGPRSGPSAISARGVFRGGSAPFAGGPPDSRGSGSPVRALAGGDDSAVARATAAAGDGGRGAVRVDPDVPGPRRGGAAEVDKRRRHRSMLRKNASTWSAAALALAGTSYLAFLTGASESPTPVEVRTTPALGSEENVRALFAKWVANHERAGGDRNVVLGLGWSKGLSKEYTKARGRVRLDLLDGAVSVEARDLPEGVSEVWLVDNIDRPGDSCAPEVGDAFIRVGSLAREGEVARLQADLGDDTFAKFDVDVVVVARDGKGPVSGGVLFGSPTFFQRFYRQVTRGSRDPAQSLSLAMMQRAPRTLSAQDPLLAVLSPLQIVQSPPSPVQPGSNLFFI